MAKIFITGSSDGLGLLAAKKLIADGHEVVAHARNESRRNDAQKELPPSIQILTADLRSLEETKRLADSVNALGKFDAVIHNAGVYTASAKDIFAVNTLAPYILTCLIEKPNRLIYLSSGMHLQGSAKLEVLKKNLNTFTYSDSKLHVILLCFAVARYWKDVYANAVNPGWVPTKMGGKGAPDDLQKGYETQVWLATGNDEQAKVSGRYFFHQAVRAHHPEADDVNVQTEFLKMCEEKSGGVVLARS